MILPQKTKLNTYKTGYQFMLYRNPNKIIIERIDFLIIYISRFYRTKITIIL